jgi:hypothetical protein
VDTRTDRAPHVGEFGGPIQRRHVLPIRHGNIGPDVGVFHGFDVLDGAILRVARHVARLEFPAKAGAKDEVAHGLVIRYFRRSHKHLENDPGFASIDDIVHMIAQVRAATLQAHRRRIRISRADPQVGRALIVAMHCSTIASKKRRNTSTP